MDDLVIREFVDGPMDGRREYVEIDRTVIAVTVFRKGKFVGLTEYALSESDQKMHHRP